MNIASVFRRSSNQKKLHRVVRSSNTVLNEALSFVECSISKECAHLRQVKGNDSFGKVKEPGLLLADCLLLAGIVPNRTRDDVSGGFNSTQDRFHAYGPQRLVAGKTDDW